ncbi:sodium:proton antiporter [Nocardioides seonyuensis]|uniref:Sodium:proton antiporter n=1 Tax=Nocardioides seonyuensis TaxID=2518371 RepID=A0A4P7IJ17_9ACTN|nr:sodium:proton antiporter [Nocardioides seonyuensis]
MHVSGVDLAYLVAGVTLVLALIVPTLVQRVAISSPIVLLAIGLLLGLSPITDGMPLDMREHRAVIEHVTELAVLMALMGVGLAIDRPLRLRDAASLRTWSPTWRLLAIAMPLSVLGVAALGLVGGLSLPLAVLLGAALSPTDPVLASDVQVGGPDVEAGGDVPAEDAGPDEGGGHEERSEVRFALTSEAGLNDGLAFPFVYAALVLAAEGSGMSRLAEWVGFHLVLRVLVGVAVGVLVGFLLGKLYFRRKSELTRIAERGAPLLALAALLTSYGAAEVLQGYGFLAVFACAMTLRAAERNHPHHRNMHDMIARLELLLTLLALLYLGIALGHGLLGELTWWGAAIGLALVFVIRPLAGWVALSAWPRPAAEPGGLTRAERGAVAFFGVRGIGSIFYLAYAVGVLQTTVEAWLWATVAFTIVLSVVVHGVLATPVMRRIEAQEEARR